jgi:hypothetical protein
MKWYRSNIDKSIKRIKYGFLNPVLPYTEDRLSHHLNKSLDIIGFGNDYTPNHYLRPSCDIINYNMFDENFLLEHCEHFNKLISYNIITNEILLNNNEELKLYVENESVNLFRYCNHLISCLQYDRRIFSTISGIL